MAAPVYVTGNVPTAFEFNQWFVNILYAVKPTDTGRVSTTTLADDPDLTVTVAANATYHCIIGMLHNSQPAGDLKYTLVGPSGTTLAYIGETVIVTGANFIDDQLFGAALADVVTSGGLSGVNVPVRIEGFLITSSTAGTFKVQWAQNTSNAGASTVRAGSFMILRRVA